MGVVRDYAVLKQNNVDCAKKKKKQQQHTHTHTHTNKQTN